MFRTCTVAMGMVVVKDMLQTTYVCTSVLVPEAICYMCS